jgi:hypothetical protein
MHEPQPTVFVLRIRGKPGPPGIHALRALLKQLLRQHGFRCLDAREEEANSNDQEAPPETNTR